MRLSIPFTNFALFCFCLWERLNQNTLNLQYRSLYCTVVLSTGDVHVMLGHAGDVHVILGHARDVHVMLGLAESGYDHWDQCTEVHKGPCWGCTYCTEAHWECLTQVRSTALSMCSKGIQVPKVTFNPYVTCAKFNH